MRAAEKRPVAMDEIQNIVDQVETKIRAVGGNEVSSQLIGEYVMEILDSKYPIALYASGALTSLVFELL